MMNTPQIYDRYYRSEDFPLPESPKGIKYPIIMELAKYRDFRDAKQYVVIGKCAGKYIALENSKGASIEWKLNYFLDSVKSGGFNTTLKYFPFARKIRKLSGKGLSIEIENTISTPYGTADVISVKESKKLKSTSFGKEELLVFTRSSKPNTNHLVDPCDSNNKTLVCKITNDPDGNRYAIISKIIIVFPIDTPPYYVAEYGREYLQWDMPLAYKQRTIELDAAMKKYHKKLKNPDFWNSEKQRAHIEEMGRIIDKY